MAASFHLLSSTRYDKVCLDLPWNTLANGGIQTPYLLLHHHLERLHDAAVAHGWNTAESLTSEDFVRACDGAVRDALSQVSPDAPLKLRILVNHTGVPTASAAVATPLPTQDPSIPALFTAGVMSSLACRVMPMLNCGPILAIHPDIEPTPPTLFTRTKTTHRPEYTAARMRMNLPPLPAPSFADVLLYAPSGELMETAIRNIAFLRGSPTRWVTPRAEAGCLPGVMRRWLLEGGKIVEGELMKHDLVDGEYALTFNGVEGCRLGRIVFILK